MMELEIMVFILLGLMPFNHAQENEKVDFAALHLNKKALKGSRWAIEQSKKITVYHAFDIVDMVKVDTNDMSIRVDFHVKQRWSADGLDFPEGLFLSTDSNDKYVTAEEDVLQSVWSPDSFIPNARDTRILSAATSHSAVNIYKNKTIVFKARMYSVLGCSFTFAWYPLDIQVCDLTFESHKHTTDVVTYEWETNPVSVADGIILYQYDFKLPPRIEKGIHRRWAGKFYYPYVKIAFKFERKLGNNIIQIFTPTTLVVILSFFSFWLGLDAVPGRISLLVTCILTLVTMHSGLKGTIPPVHYIKMMDIWMIGCMCFVFGAICEFVLVKYMKWRATQIKNAEEEREKYLKEHGLLQPSFPVHMEHGAPGYQGMEDKMNLPNMHHSAYPPPPNYNQLRENGNGYENAKMKRPRPPVIHTGEKRQAWESQPFGMVPPGDYPASGVMDMHHVAIYDQHMIPPPPPFSRPLWVSIDRVCRILFPLLFCAFNGAYWPILLKGSEKQHSDA